MSVEYRVMPLDESVLLAMLQSDDPNSRKDAFATIYAAYAHVISNLVRSRFPALRDECPDIVQETFMALFDAFQKGKGPQLHIRPYLVSVATRKAWDALGSRIQGPAHTRAHRKQHFSVETLDDAFIDSLPSQQADVAVEATNRAMIDGVLANLDDGDYIILTMWPDFTSQEIGEALKRLHLLPDSCKNVGEAVRSRFRRLSARIRRELKSDDS